MRRGLILVVLSVLAAPAAWAQAPSRDAVATAPPAGSISGQIVSDGTPPQSIRRAIITLSGAPGGDRGVVTDDDGRFEFNGLATGHYTVTALKPAYLSVSYGAAKPGAAGTPIALEADQHADVSLTMPKGAVLEGRLADARGGAMPGAYVAAYLLRPGETSGKFVKSTTTDDRGAYRLFGLSPGAYTVMASFPMTSIYSIEEPSPAEIDAAIAAIGSRALFGSSPPSSPRQGADPLEPAVRYSPVYYPGVPSLDDAATVTLSAGEERTGLDFRFDPVRTTTIEGTVTGPVRDLSQTQLTLQFAGTGASPAGGNATAQPQPDGSFVFRNIAPGRYRLTARASVMEPDSGQAAPRTPGVAITTARPVLTEAARTAGETYLYAQTTVDARAGGTGAVSLVLQPGATLSGLVAFETLPNTPVPVSGAAVRVLPTQVSSAPIVINGGFTAVRQGTAGATGAFTVTSIAPGEYTVQVSLPTALKDAGWWPKSMPVQGRDLLDGPSPFTTGEELKGLTVVLSNRHTKLSGVLRTSDGRPGPDHTIVVFSTDSASWSATARRTQMAQPANDGTYVIDDLPPGDYYVAVVTEIDRDELLTPQFFERLVPASIRVQLGDGEARTQDLTLAR